MKIFRIAGALLLSAVLLAGSARVARAELSDDDQQKAQDLKKAGEAADRHRADLMKIPHVTGVVAETNEENEAALLVEIDDPENNDEVTRTLPSQIEGFPVQVDVAVGDDSTDEDANDDDSNAHKLAHSLAGGGIVGHDAGAKTSAMPTAMSTPSAAKH